MAKRFLFLEITDPEIVGLISGLREVAMEQKPRSGVHITVRGPYHRMIPLAQVEQYRQILMSHPVLLDGIGQFQSGEQHVVYIKVKHPKLRQVWWKPDFPVRDFGFNPHVTIYEGPDAARAARIQSFLKRERLKFLTTNFRVTPYVSDHPDFFATHQCTPRLFLELVNRRLVRADILSRMNRTLHAPLPAGATGAAALR